MHKHAWRLREKFNLDFEQLTELQSDIGGNLVNMAVAGLSVLIVAVSNDKGTWSGFIYCLLGPLHWWNGARHAKKKPPVAIEDARDAGKERTKEAPKEASKETT
ncbi:hypothetical protein ACO0LL_18925 [Undibacterium sp. TC4M20W]|uniref:hypothetical protein n=1 Tax=Undibacterium sp. TC4M20W TaxID=3413052 RepID=UPI003BF407F4